MVAKPTTPASKEMNHQNHCHLCSLCLSDSELLLLDDVGEGFADHTADERQAIFFIGGYVAYFKHREHAGTPHQTPADVQAFLARMDRHGFTLKIRLMACTMLYSFVHLDITTPRMLPGVLQTSS